MLLERPPNLPKSWGAVFTVKNSQVLITENTRNSAALNQVLRNAHLKSWWKLLLDMSVVFDPK